MTLSFHAKEYDGNALYPYVVIEGRAAVTDGGALDVMDHLAAWYIGPGSVSQPGDAAGLDVPRLGREEYGQGPWNDRWVEMDPKPGATPLASRPLRRPAAKAAPIKATSRPSTRRTSFHRRLGRWKDVRRVEGLEVA